MPLTWVSDGFVRVFIRLGNVTMKATSSLYQVASISRQFSFYNSWCLDSLVLLLNILFWPREALKDIITIYFSFLLTFKFNNATWSGGLLCTRRWYTKGSPKEKKGDYCVKSVFMSMYGWLPDFLYPRCCHLLVNFFPIMHIPMRYVGWLRFTNSI